ncbi:putative retrotransposon gag domain-containing protein [Helianthus anomalus]
MPSNNSTARRTAWRRARRSADKRIASLVTREVVKLIPQIVAQVHSLSNSRTPEDVKAEPVFLYKHFKACDPMPFTGEGGVSQLLQWFDAIEVTLRRSGCPEGFQTTCATGVFQSRALNWWTTERNKCGIYCPPHELQKLEDEFWQLKQDKGDNASYTARFKQLSVICPSQVDTPRKAIAKYTRGLPECVGDYVEAAKPATIKETYQLAAEVNDKRVLSGFFSTNPVKQAHQAIFVDSSGKPVNGSSDDFHENSSKDSSDNSSGNFSKDSSDDASSGSLDEASDDTASTREAQPNPTVSERSQVWKRFRNLSRYNLFQFSRSALTTEAIPSASGVRTITQLEQAAVTAPIAASMVILPGTVASDRNTEELSSSRKTFRNNVILFLMLL